MKIPNKKDFLRVFPFFKGAPDPLVTEILAYGRPHVFQREQAIFHENDACTAVGFFFSGEVRIYKSGPAGREITLYTVGRGDACILNASCILSNSNYPANATAMEVSGALLVPASHFRRLVNQYAEMRAFVFSNLGERLFAVIELVEAVLFRKLDGRLLDYLREKARGGALRTSHREIANDLGTSREVVSRLLKELERSGAVVTGRNRIRLLP
jgi:CRP/FNR family transcriptional regulator